MRVACIGNMNNNFFALVRFLRDKGLDAHLLLLDNESSHFHPSADTFSQEYTQYTSQLQWGNPYKFHLITRNKIMQDLEDYSFVVGCSSVPAFLAKAGRDLNIFTPHGSDLYDYPFFKLELQPKFFFLNMIKGLFPYYQKRGIRRARCINADTEAPLFQNVYRRLNLSKALRHFPVPMVYTPVYNPESIQQYYPYSEWYPEFKRARDDFDILIFHHSRLFWTPTNVYAQKGNDLLLKGFARFVRAAGHRAGLILLAYGPDVEATKALIRQLGIQSNVRWFPQLPRKEVMVGLSLCDVGTGLFKGGWLSNGVLMEVLAMGKPLLHYRNDMIYRKSFPDLYPMMNASSEEEICLALMDYARRPAYYRSLGEEGRRWFYRYFVERSLAGYLEQIRRVEQVSSCHL